MRALLKLALTSSYPHSDYRFLQVDMNGKRNPSEGVNLLPFIDAARMRDCPPQALTPEELARNSFGDPIGSCLSTFFFKDQPSLVLSLQSSCTTRRPLRALQELQPRHRTG